MGVKERFPYAPPGNRKGESDQIGALEGAKDVSSRLRGNHEKRERDHINIRGLPYCTLDTDACLEFLDPVALANGDAVGCLGHCRPCGGCLRRSPRIHEPVPEEIFQSNLIFAASHRRSSSSLDSLDKS